MLEYNEITVRKYIIYENEPYEVLGSHVFRKQQRKPVNAVKLKNLITGNIKEISFHVSDKVEEAEIEKKEIKYLYSNKGQHWFCEMDNPSKRFQLPETLIGDKVKFLRPNTVITALMFGDSEDAGEKDERLTIGVELPVKVELKVTEAHPAVKGDTAKGGNKTVVLETGATLSVPMFITEGEILRINTETGEYVERVGK